MEQIAMPISTFCKTVGIKRSLAYKMLANQEIEGCKIGRRTLITKRSVDALIERGIAEAQQAWKR